MCREATLADIPGMQRIRGAVTENRLSDPALVTDAAVADYITRRGKGWVCEEDGSLAGFAIVDLGGHSVWALFVDPGWEGTGIGKKLMGALLSWYFERSRETIWLSTAPGTRAEIFYARNGWIASGSTRTGEILFEMHYRDWQTSKP